MTTPELISINDAVHQRISYLRKPIWADPLAHLKLDIFDFGSGPWIHLYDPCNALYNGRDPVNVLCIEFDLGSKQYVPYTGPLADSDEYRASVEAHKRADVQLNQGEQS